MRRGEVVPAPEMIDLHLHTDPASSPEHLHADSASSPAPLDANLA
jgi:hypothetical protein